MYRTLCGEGLTKLLRSTCVCLDSICHTFLKSIISFILIFLLENPHFTINNPSKFETIQACKFVLTKICRLIVWSLAHLPYSSFNSFLLSSLINTLLPPSYMCPSDVIGSNLHTTSNACTSSLPNMESFAQETLLPNSFELKDNSNMPRTIFDFQSGPTLKFKVGNALVKYNARYLLDSGEVGGIGRV